ncbi:hypothetical protein TNCV_2015391 [Trichonephila clavipes]|nr:hypothetical protein TNCV_2015391 [Trichonephila clavipes]
MAFQMTYNTEIQSYLYRYHSRHTQCKTYQRGDVQVMEEIEPIDEYCFVEVQLREWLAGSVRLRDPQLPRLSTRCSEPSQLGVGVYKLWFSVVPGCENHCPSYSHI